MNQISNYDISDIGSVYFTLNYDDDWYNEYLSDEGLQDNANVKAEYIKDYCDYDVEFTDSETYHHLGYDTMTFDEIEDFFGETMANEVFKDCMDGEQHEYEPYRYISQSVDITDPNELSAAAVKYLQHGRYFKNARGFILPSGVVVYTDQEHNLCSKIPGVEGTFHFIGLGCIRVLPNGIDMSKAPTPAQTKVIYQVLKCYENNEFYIDLMNKEIGNFSKKYDYCDPDEVVRDINNYFKGIKPSNSMYESKTNKIRLNESQFKTFVKNIVNEVLNEMCIDTPRDFRKWCKRKGYENIDMLPTWKADSIYKEYESETKNPSKKIRLFSFAGINENEEKPYWHKFPDEMPEPNRLLYVIDAKGNRQGHLSSKIVWDGECFRTDLAHSLLVDANNIVGWRYLDEPDY